MNIIELDLTLTTTDNDFNGLIPHIIRTPNIDNRRAILHTICKNGFLLSFDTFICYAGKEALHYVYEDLHPLHVACIHTHIKLVEKLITCGVNVNLRTRTCGSTALMFACASNNVPLVELLFENKADITMANNYGNNALGFANMTCSIKMIEYVESLYSSKSALTHAWYEINILSHSRNVGYEITIAEQNKRIAEQNKRISEQDVRIIEQNESIAELNETIAKHEATISGFRNAGNMQKRRLNEFKEKLGIITFVRRKLIGHLPEFRKMNLRFSGEVMKI